MISLYIIKIFILLFLDNKKGFFTYKKKYIYNLIIINKKSISNRNGKVNKETKPLLVLTL